MVFYAGVNYTATVRGSTAVAVRCEDCGRKYYYRLVCTASGRSQAPYGLGAEGAKRRARQIAKNRLRRMLENEILAIPCPSCGWYQEEMLPLLRKGRLRGLKIAGIASLGVAGAAALLVVLMGMANRRPSADTESAVLVGAGVVAAIAVIAGSILLRARRHLNAAYDPNAPETELERIKLGRRYAITREEAEEIMAAE